MQKVKLCCFRTIHWHAPGPMAFEHMKPPSSTSIFDTLQKNLSSVDFSLLLTDVMTKAMKWIPLIVEHDADQ
jgi:hypothetical protein